MFHDSIFINFWNIEHKTTQYTSIHHTYTHATFFLELILPRLCYPSYGIHTAHIHSFPCHCTPKLLYYHVGNSCCHPHQPPHWMNIHNVYRRSPGHIHRRRTYRYPVHYTSMNEFYNPIKRRHIIPINLTRKKQFILTLWFLSSQGQLQIISKSTIKLSLSPTG